jgi:hypothetical protein
MNFRTSARATSSLLGLATVAAVFAAALGAGGCAVETDAGEAHDELVTSNTRVLLTPLTDASRAECREAAQTVYCDEASARAAAAKCASKPGDVILDARTGSCVAGQRLYPTAASCKQPVDFNCGFYAGCLERSTPCGKEGYALAFGEKYCTAFRAGDLSPAGKAWMRNVMGCLQRALVPQLPTNFATSAASAQVCKSSIDTAFGTHPACYTAPENSVCFLPVSDLTKVLGTIGMRELLTQRTATQSVSTAGICLKQLTDRALRGFFGRATGSRIVADSEGRVAEMQGPELSAAELTELHEFWQNEVSRAEAQ